MKIAMGPITLVRPGWGLDRGALVTLTTSDGSGRPDVLAAQTLCSAALQGARVLMLLPDSREQDETWKAMVQMLTDGTPKSAAQAMSHMKISMHTCGTGWEKARQTDLVYVSNLRAQDLRRLGRMTDAPILNVGTEVDVRSAKRPMEVIRVGGDHLLLDSEGFEMSVTYDPSGPIYRPA